LLTAVAAALALALAPQASADEASATTPSTPTAGATTPPVPASTPTSTPPPSTVPAPPPPEAGAEPDEANAGPQVQAQHLQHTTSGSTGKGTGAAHAKAHGNGPASGTAGREQTQATGGTSGAESPTGRYRAPSPSALTPGLPLSLGGSIAGVPGFFIESFRIPPFLLTIYQAAGTAYGIPWQVLAAINEVETDYGRDLSVSSAGAEGWMQFLPSTWAQYGVDANGDGFKDPYNPADAIFAAARYLRAAGGDRNVRAAVYSYNHWQAYVDSVMLRAQLLGGTPPELLGAITGLTEARFPVHAPSHFSDGFATVPAHGSNPAKTLAGTTIYSQAGAPVIAVQDGEVVRIGSDSPTLGKYVSLRDAYGNTYTYAQLGGVATLYPVLQPRDHPAVSARIAQSGGASEPAPSGPATAGAQPRSPLSDGATASGLALGAAAGLEPAPTPATSAPAPSPPPLAPGSVAPTTARVFRSGPNNVYLHPLRAGVQVIAGTVLGHVGAEAGGVGDAGAGAQGTGSGATQPGEPHMFFQIKPAGIDAPPIDPKPILDGWVALENTSIFRAKGENPFLQTSPSTGQVLLESKRQLEQQVAHDASVHMHACERREVQTGGVDRRVLAVLEFLSVSGLKPTVTGLGCAAAAPIIPGNPPAGLGGATVKITAVNGVPIAGHQGQGSIADTTIHKLLTLQGINRPLRIVSDTSIPGTNNTLVKPSARNYVYVAFSTLSGGGTHVAGAFGSVLSAKEWIKLIARLGEIPDPTVASGPSAAAVPDKPGARASGGGSTGGKESATPGGSGAGGPNTGRSGAGTTGDGTSEGGAGGHG
jgi:murein DD-endopeptidase MepM/ murein hydrolase activator NlpD